MRNSSWNWGHEGVLEQGVDSLFFTVYDARLTKLVVEKYRN